MKYPHRPLIVATALAAGLVVAIPLATGAVRAADNIMNTADPGFVPDTGQINLGIAIQGASQSNEIITIPTPQEARAAKLTPISTQPSTGDQRTNSPQPDAATTGAGASTNGEPSPWGPIGSVGQTVPAKFFPRNDVLDRVPTMAFPLSLTDQQRQQIYQAVMADKAQPAADADALTMASALSIDQALDGMHEMPASVRGIVDVKGLKYVKGKNKVLLVEPATRVVVDEITA